MREKEKAGVIESIKYARSLKREKKLHPAIITACQTVDDLDIYLACLDNCLFSLFDSFEIKFECLPTKVARRYKNK